MSIEWHETTLGNVLTLQRGFDLPVQNRQHGRFPVIASTGEVGRHVDHMVQGPGVVIGRSGSIGGGQYIQENFWPLNTTLWVKDFKGNNPRYCYYLLKSLDLASFNVGSGVPTLNRNHVHPIKVLVPKQRIGQDAIANILGSLDDKIELNRKMNETLESMARALFKSWFIDFNPVRAKMEGRKSFGMDDETAALFPDKFEESDLGVIPEGWKVSSIKELANKIQYGLTQSANPEKIGPHFLRITDIQGGECNWDNVPFCKVSSKDLAKYKLCDGDVVVARTGASTGENMLIVQPPEAVFASYLIRFQFDEPAMARFVGCYMRLEEYFSFIGGIRGGSAQPNANAQQLSSAILAVPPISTVQYFYEIIKPMELLRRRNEDENEILIKTRDLLLPRLLSGELQLKDAEKKLAEAM